MSSGMQKAGLLALAFLALLVGGYLSFRFFALNVMPAFDAFSLTFLAIVAGIAVFFSPCSFPVLPSYLSYYASQRPQQHLVFPGLFAALGVVAFSVVLGVVIGLLGESAAGSLSISSAAPNPFVLGLRFAVGAVLVTLGVFSLMGKSFHLHFLTGISKRFSLSGQAGYKGFFAYGFGYSLIGIGCAGPILAGLVVFALSTGGLTSSLYAFSVYALTMATLMVFVSALAGQTNSALLQAMQKHTVKVKKLSAILLVAVGAVLILTTLFREQFVAFFFP